MAEFRLCSVKGCGKPALARGWCNVHYLRWQTHGDPRADKPIRPYRPREGAPLFSLCRLPGCERPTASTALCARHLKRWKKYGDPLVRKIARYPQGAPLAYLLRHMRDGCCAVPWPFTTRPYGYPQVTYEGKSTSGTRLVCMLANGPAPEGRPLALHSCGRGHLGCFNAACLYWGSPADNNRDTSLHGRWPVHRPRKDQKLSGTKVRAIRTRAKAGESQHSVARRFHVSQGLISRVIAGKVWGWVKD